MQSIPAVGPNFVHKAAALNEELEKGQQSLFDATMKERTDAPATLKEKLVSAPAPALKRIKGYFTLYMEVYDKQMGCFLVRWEPDRTEKKLTYCSGMPLPALQSFGKTHPKCLAVVLDVLLLLPYFGVKFTVHVYHDALKGILTLPDTTRQLVRWQHHFLTSSLFSIELALRNELV